ncbi:MAG TPA: HEAT repeat domain-containing protein [Acidimicrobiales bacterium]|nr:HEAT repeat domain-containing protein [Acidimicrobiales bacterium]
MTAGEARRRGRAARAGHVAGGEAEARGLQADPSPRVRATALAALARLGRATAADVAAGLADPDPAVRRRACAVAVAFPAVDLVPLAADPDPSVVEAAAWALGERPASAAAVAALGAVAASHADALCREAAVAALGALGDPAGLPVILAATGDKPAVRRRAVLALAPFEGPDVEAALRRALDDRDRQVRQAAEDLLDG